MEEEMEKGKGRKKKGEGRNEKYTNTIIVENHNGMES